MVGVTAADLQSSVTQLRAKLADGSWGEWITPDLIDGSSNGKQGTEPVFVGDTNAVQILVTPRRRGGRCRHRRGARRTDPTDPALRAPVLPRLRKRRPPKRLHRRRNPTQPSRSVTPGRGVEAAATGDAHRERRRGCADQSG